MTTMPKASRKYDVGGVLLDRPFRIRRLGHFGYDVADLDACLHFYRDLLGFRVSDFLPGTYAFTRYGSDHHAMVLFNKDVSHERAKSGPMAHHFRAENTINQITWQLQSRREVVDATEYFRDLDLDIRTEGRAGGRGPGSNFHLYVYDPDQQINELYYGIEQIGWDGFSKPVEMRPPGEAEAVPGPHISEWQEVTDALARNGIPSTGYRHTEPAAATYEVDGVLIQQPFKIVRIGPVHLFTESVDASTAYYRDVLGFTITEEVSWQGERCIYLRCNTEHHSLGLFPVELRNTLGLSAHTSSMALGLQVANYRQLRDAVAFLRKNGVRVETDVIPTNLYPGIDYAAFAFDPDGHCLMLYYYMEQVGWDGQPRSAASRRAVDSNNWPDRLEPASDTYTGETLLGPWA
ncbi:MAG: VOC family protein [Chloroflexi bacterium]|nr:VOC family protein [Chloroflexota bacterium]